jgi:SAM-dependent methyltransferase
LLAGIERLHRRMPRRRILDVGCGDGLFFDRLQKFGQVEGIEPDASLVNDPRWRPRIKVAPLEPGSFAPGAYDLVLMLDVLEHIADDRAALLAARSSLRPGGHLVLTVPALSLLWSRHDEANAHHRRYAPRGLRATLEAAGFEVETVRFFFFWTVAPMLFRRLLSPAGSARGAADYDVRIPPPPINRTLDALSRLEHAAGRWVRWPWGSSLLAIARKP